MRPLLLLLRVLLATTLTSILLGTIAVGGAYYYLSPTLPSTEVLKEVRLQVPLRVYSRDGKLMAEFGEMKRTPVDYDKLPKRLIQAVLAAEDDRFFSHPGVDYQGVLRAVVHLVKTGRRSQGASTITMQVARNFFLTPEKTITRKISETFLALKIERELTKEEILDLYLNKIYLGNRAYGVAEAAHVYYGKDLDQLSLAEMAMIAGLPKAPSNLNPVVNPDGATARRAYVLSRMLELGYINNEEYKQASAEPVATRVHATQTEADAPYVAEMVRAEMLSRFGDEAYTHGYMVYTTVDPRLQNAATESLRKGLLDYDRRHGYHGPEGHIDLKGAPTAEQLRQVAQRGTVGGLLPAVVTKVADKSAEAMLGNGEPIKLEWTGLSWARKFIETTRLGAAPKNAGEILKVGDLVRLERPRAEQKATEQGWRLAEVPQASAALVALNPKDGAILSLAGGFDFYQSNFNRVTQAQRQPGSNFKPFIYSAALDQGFTPASLINDAPLVFEIPGSEPWRPENYGGRFYGPTRLREALVRSRNLVSIRLLQAIGVDTAVDYLIKFGFDPARLPRNLSLSLGTATVTPLELVRGYAALANGGFRVDPYVIDRIEDIYGNVIYKATPPTVCENCLPEAVPPAALENGPVAAASPASTTTAAATPVTATAPGDGRPARVAPRIADARNIYMMNSIMRDVIRFGTGHQATELGRGDLAGKTGTTNDQKDAWFSGFNPSIVASVWVGYDTPIPLGNLETGARAALPIWIDYMREALKGVPEQFLPQPSGIVTARVDSETGLRTGADNPHAIMEVFRDDNLPEEEGSSYASTGTDGSGGVAGVGGSGGGTAGGDDRPLTEQLF